MVEPRILVVEDEALVAEDIRRTLQNLGYGVSSTASSGEEAIEKANRDRPDLVLMDIVLQGKMDGIETAGRISSGFGIPIIYITAYSDKTTLNRVRLSEPFGYIIKPFREKELKMAVEIALFKHETQKKLKTSREWLSTTLGSINEAVIAADAENRVEFMNLSARSLLGMKNEEIRGKFLWDAVKIIDEKTGGSSPEITAAVSGKGIIRNLRTVLISRNMKKVPVEICSAPIKDSTGSVKGTVMVIRDITERKKAEEALRQSEEKYRTMIENARDIIFILSREGKIVSLNPSFETVTGWERSEWVGRSFQDIIHPGDLPYAEDLFQRTIGGETPPAKFELHIRLKSGDYLLMEFTVAPQVQDGTIESLLGIARDITERKRAEEELRLSEEKYRKLIENNQDGVFIMQDSRIQFANEAFARMAGYTVEEVIGMDFRERVAPEDLEMVSERYRQRLLGVNVPKEYEFRALHRDGSRFTVNMNVGLITYNGKIASMGTLKDITERKRAEDALRESEERYRRLVEYSPYGIAIHSDNKIVYVNIAGMRILGAEKPEDLIGKPVFQIIHPDYHETVKERIRLQEQGKIAPLIEEKFLRFDGSPVSVEIVSIPFTYKGKPAMYGVFQDITERKHAGEEIQRRAEIQVSLNKLLQISLQNHSLEEILEQVIDHLTSISWLSLQSMGGIWLVDEEPDVLVLKAQRGFPAPLRTACERIPFGRCICGQAASSGQIEFVDRIDEKHDIRYPEIAPHGHYCVPLKSSGRVLGIINLFLKEGHRREEKEEDFLGAIADVLVGIIHRKQGEEAIRRSSEFSKTVLNSMNDGICIINP